MAMLFEELDAATRRYMRTEYAAEHTGGNPYWSAVLSFAGRERFHALMIHAIQHGDEETLRVSLEDRTLWRPTDAKGSLVMADHAAERLAITEFNTWYVRGLAKRLLEEGHTRCQVHRAAPAGEGAAPCGGHDGQIVEVAAVYAGHRSHYWPPPGDRTKLMIPFSPNCHHTIRRLRAPL